MNGELIEYLDKKFNKINETLEEIKTDVGVNKTNILFDSKEAKEVLSLES